VIYTITQLIYVFRRRSDGVCDNGVHNLIRRLTHGWTEGHTHMLFPKAMRGVHIRIRVCTNVPLLTMNTITGDALTGIPSWELIYAYHNT
jgi:hypothetical protein